MSIDSFIQAAKTLYQNSHYNEALCLVCNAIDACAAKTYPALSVTNRYKSFLSQHFRTISKVGFPGVEASKIRIRIDFKIDNVIPDKGGYVDIEQIIYHAIRCSLVHTCSMEDTIVFVNQTMIGNFEPGKFYLPRNIIWGLIAAVNEENGS
ncbi:MAG: hypothetical protein HFE86_08620 [Clostridiales bacterium]|nr:hypothetical protein [Clostridiales bacterium]